MDFLPLPSHELVSQRPAACCDSHARPKEVPRLTFSDRIPTSKIKKHTASGDEHHMNSEADALNAARHFLHRAQTTDSMREESTVDLGDGLTIVNGLRTQADALIRSQQQPSDEPEYIWPNRPGDAERVRNANERKSVRFSDVVDVYQPQPPPPPYSKGMDVVLDDDLGMMDLCEDPLIETPVLPPTIVKSDRRKLLHGVRSRLSYAPSSIVGMELGLLSEDEIRRMAFSITETEKLSENGVPKIGGVNDPRQGVTQNRFLCPTCGCDALECNGHLGMIILPWPVFHVGQFLSSIIENLHLVCWACSRLRFDVQSPDSRLSHINSLYPPGLPSPDRVSALASLGKCIRVCPHCEAPQPSYSAVKNMHAISWNWLVKKIPPKKFLEIIQRLGPSMFEETNRPFTAARAYDIFTGVSDEDWKYCGVNSDISHPKNKILRVLPVPPNALRPTFSSTEGSSMQGMPDMTTLLHTHVSKTVASIWKTLARGRVDEVSAYKGGVAPDFVPDDIWRKRSWQDIIPSQVFKKARVALAQSHPEVVAATYPSVSTGIIDDQMAGKIVYPKSVPRAEDDLPNLQQQVHLDRRKGSSHAIISKLGGNWSGTISSKDIIAKTKFVDPIEEQRVLSLIEMTKPDVLCKTARTHAACGIEGAEWAVASIPADYEKLQLVIAALYLNDDRSAIYKDAKQRNGAPLRGIHMTLNKKTGMVKSSLMATRSFFSARSVVTAAAGELDIDEIGVPASFAKMITIPERVTNFNIHKLQECVKTGPNALGGASTIIRANTGERIYLTHIASREDRMRVCLKVGDVVERHLRDGDYVMINRQPTLHGPSMIACRVRIHGDETFKLHLALTKPLNADFDGDEINMHVPQTIEAVAEIQQLMAAQWQIILAKDNAPCIGNVQDTVAAAYRLTRGDVFLTKDKMMQLVAQLRYPSRYDHRPQRLPAPAIMKPRPLWTGKQAFSLVLPRILQLETSIEGCPVQDVMDADERAICIQQGELMCGVLTKSVFGISPGGITHRVAMDGGPQTVKAYLSDVTRLLHEWFQKGGFSVGIDDVSLPSEAHMDTFRTLKSAEVAITRAEHLRDELGTRINETDDARLEGAAFSSMTAALERASDVERAHRASSMWRPENALDDMIRAGSKGKNENRESLKVGLGVTIIGSSRVKRDASGRTLPSFMQNDPCPAAQGFVRGNYMDGLNPAEYYFHAMASRRGLADTAVKTAETGYMQKRATKFMEANVARSDGSIRGVHGRIVQACYGGDGMDPRRVEFVGLPVFAMGDAELCSAVGGTTEFQTEMLHMRDNTRYLRLSPTFDAIEAKVQLPVNAWRGGWCSAEQKPIDLIFKDVIFGGILGKEECKDGEVSESNMESTCCRLLLRFSEWMKSRHGIKASTMILSALWELRPVRVLANRTKRGQSGWGWDRLVNALSIVASRYERALVAEGEAAGIVAAQSIGEPSTQMTLNTFHASGKGNAHMSMGVPRIHEIFDRRKSENMKSKSMVLITSKNTRSAAEALARKLKRISLADVVHVDCFVAKDPVPTQTDLDKDEFLTNIPDDRELLMNAASLFGKERDLDPDGCHLSPYVIRIQLNKEFLVDLGISSPIFTVVSAIRNACVHPVVIVHSDEGAGVWVIRVRIWDANPDPQSPLKTRTASVRMYAQILERAQANGTHKLSDPSVCEISEVVTEAHTGALRKKAAWAVSVRGSSLQTVATIDGVDWERCTTNDLNEIEREFGVCAVEDAIAKELYTVLTFDGSHIDKRHVSLVASAMTHRGRWHPMTRHGLAAMDTSTLHQASFEQTSSKLQEGALRGEFDFMDTPAGAMCLSGNAPVGTGCVAVRRLYKMPKGTPVVTRRMMMELQNGMIRQSAIKPRRMDSGVAFDAKTGMEIKQAAKVVESKDDLKVTQGPARAYSVRSAASGASQAIYADAQTDLKKLETTVETQLEPSEKVAQVIARAGKPEKRRRDDSSWSCAPTGKRSETILEKGMKDVVRSKKYAIVASIEDPLGLGEAMSAEHEPDTKRTRVATSRMLSERAPNHNARLGIVTSFVNQFGKVQDVCV